MRVQKRQPKPLNLSDGAASEDAEPAGRETEAAPEQPESAQETPGPRAAGHFGVWSASRTELTPPPIRLSPRSPTMSEPAIQPAPIEPPNDAASKSLEPPPAPSAGGEDAIPGFLRAEPAPASIEPPSRLRPRAPIEPRPALQRLAPTPGAGPAERDDAELGFARYSYVIAALAGLTWSGSFVAFVLGFAARIAPLTYSPFQAVVLGALTILPAGFMITAAAALRQGARLAAETRRARRLADDLITPAALAAAEAGGVLNAVRQEVERAAGAAHTVKDEFASLRDAFGEETDRMSGVAADVQRTSRVMGETLAQERDGVAALVAELQARGRELSAAVGQQTRVVAESSDLARSQLQEAEATLAARAVSLAAAGAEAAERAREAGEHMGRETERLNRTTTELAGRLSELEGRLGERRRDLAALSQDMKADQADVSARLDSQRAQLVEAIAHARIGAAELDDISGQSAEALRRLVESASGELHRLSEAADAHQDALASKAAEARTAAEADLGQSIFAIAEAAEDAFRHANSQASTVLQAAASQVEAARAQADAISRAASAHVEAARNQVEQLGELAFAAGQRSNEAFGVRIAEARRMIDQSAALLEEAGQRSTERIGTGLEAARAAMGELAATLSEVDAHVARLPDEARSRVEAVRSTVEQGVEELAAAARRVAEETQSIDQAFQERVRRNYETLSEAVKLMGRVAGAPEGPRTGLATSRRPADARSARPLRREAPAAEPERKLPEAVAALPGDEDSDSLFGGAVEHAPIFAAVEPPEPSSPAVLGHGPAADRAEAEEAAEAQFEAAVASERGDGGARLRPRLRFTPTDADEAVKTMFEPIQSRPADVRPPAASPPALSSEPETPRSELDEWTWTDLLLSIEETPPADDDALAEQMIGEIQALGVDVGAILPRTRVQEIADTVASGDALAARDSVRRLAPAAVRRLSRRVLTDKALREQADRYVRRYEALLRASSERDRGLASTLLSSDPGRAYLLLDAAVGDL